MVENPERYVSFLQKYNYKIIKDKSICIRILLQVI